MRQEKRQHLKQPKSPTFFNKGIEDLCEMGGEWFVFDVTDVRENPPSWARLAPVLQQGLSLPEHQFLARRLTLVPCVLNKCNDSPRCDE